MTSHLIATLKTGQELTVAFADRAEAEAELRSIERFQRYGAWLPAIFWHTVDGQRWCLAAADFAELPRLAVPVS